MTTLFDGLINVHYGFVWLAEEFAEGFGESRTGQRNGLCGAAVPHELHLVTGLHTGAVPFRLEWHTDAPVREDGWDEVVEASVELPATDLVLGAFEEFHEVRLSQAGWHRARFHASGMDAGHELDTTEDDEAAPDRYLLQLWPAEAAPDEVLEQTSDIAAYWHGVARGERS